MTFEDVKQKVYDQEYKHKDTFCLSRKRLRHDTVIDENQTVKWNREEVARRNDALKVEIEEIHKENLKQTANFKCHLFEAANKEYRLNDNQCEMIYNKLMNEIDCNYICCDFVEEFEDLCDFIYQCWNA